eukprot:evm.model.scf_765.4 EVM.evm.TU.scf_765.4   scf_765:23400-28325(+)
MGIKQHPMWTGTVDDGNDLALIKLPRRSKIKPVQILNDNGFGEGTLFVATGDSGGPLLLADDPGGNVDAGMATNDLLVGIVSFANTSLCVANNPGVHTKVASFREWINSMIAKVPPECPLAPGTCRQAPVNKDCETVKDALRASDISPAMVYASLKDGNECCVLKIFPSDWTLLHYASENSNLEPQVVECLIQGGSDVNATTMQGRAPLHVAARWGVVQAIDVLIQRGADIDAKTPLEMYTPVHIAASHGRSAAVEALAKAGADVNEPDFAGTTPLHEGARHQATDVVEVLLKYNASIDAQDSDGKTPLHTAAAEVNLDVVKRLVGEGANKTSVDNRGRTPCDYICKMGCSPREKDIPAVKGQLMC